jgi:hypothetical protein
MRRLLLFIGAVAGLLLAAGAANWWIDPFGDIYKPAALAQAASAQPRCLISQELVGARYFSFKLDVFHRRPTRTVVLGSSRVLKISSHPGERSFANLGYPGSAPETIVELLQALPAKPPLTVYLGVEAFWFNANYKPPTTNPTTYQLAEYLLSWATLKGSYDEARGASYVLLHRWRRDRVGGTCVLGRQSPGFAWRDDGSRVWAFELDPVHGFRPLPQPVGAPLAQLRNGYYADWTSLDARRLRFLDAALALARARGWRVVGFAPPEPPAYLRRFATDPAIAPRWRAFLALMPSLFHRYGDTWVSTQDGRTLDCGPADYPDAFHTDAACSARLRTRLDAAARSRP